MKGYKAFNLVDGNLMCRNFHFVVGKWYYNTDYTALCHSGFHFCEKIDDCFTYYDISKDVVICEIEALGYIDTDTDKNVCSIINVIRILSDEEVIGLISNVNLKVSFALMCEKPHCIINKNILLECTLKEWRINWISINPSDEEFILEYCLKNINISEAFELVKMFPMEYSNILKNIKIINLTDYISAYAWVHNFPHDIDIIFSKISEDMYYQWCSMYPQYISKCYKKYNIMYYYMNLKYN